MKRNLKVSLLLILIHSFIASDAQLYEIKTISVCDEANRFITEFRFGEAIIKLDSCYKNNRSDQAYLFNLARCKYELGQFQEAKDIYTDLLEIDSNNIFLMNKMAVIYQKEMNYTSAIGQYKKLISLSPENAFYWKKSGQLKYKSNDLKGALIDFQKAHELNTRDVEVIGQLCRLNLKLNQLESSKALLEKGLSLNPEDVGLLSMKAKIHYQEKDFAETIQSVEQVVRITGDTSLLMLKLLGVSFLQTGDSEKSIVCLERALTDAPDSETLYYYLGFAYKNIGKDEKSISCFQKAIESGISENISMYYSNLAEMYESKENYGQAIKAYKMAYESSEEKEILYHLARNYDMYYKDKSTALSYYEKYMSSNDSDNVDYMDYSEHRANTLKSMIHFDVDSLEN